MKHFSKRDEGHDTKEDQDVEGQDQVDDKDVSRRGSYVNKDILLKTYVDLHYFVKARLCVRINFENLTQY